MPLELSAGEALKYRVVEPKAVCSIERFHHKSSAGSTVRLVIARAHGVARYQAESATLDRQRDTSID